MKVFRLCEHLAEMKFDVIQMNHFFSFLFSWHFNNSHFCSFVYSFAGRLRLVWKVEQEPSFNLLLPRLSTLLALLLIALKMHWNLLIASLMKHNVDLFHCANGKEIKVIQNKKVNCFTLFGQPWTICQCASVPFWKK